MKNFKYPIFIFLICALCANLQAQEKQETQSINEGSIGDQFEYAITKSNNWTDPKGQSYEVIKRKMINSLRTNTLDSLNAIQIKLDNTSSTISAHEKEINTLKTDLEKTQDTLSSTQEEKDSMSLLGMQMSKTSYSLLMWSIIAALLAFLLTFIYKFKNSNVLTKAAINARANIENEFKEHKRVALEREQKIKRQLQDEINKHAG